jgi:integrase
VYYRSITEVFRKGVSAVGRRVKVVALEKREDRKKLAVRTEPYWQSEGEGRHLGYYRGARVSKWVARYRLSGTKGGYQKTTIGEVDDEPGSIADGVRLLDYRQAKAKAAKWFDEVDRAGGIKVGPYTVDEALDDYMKAFTGKDRTNTQRRVDVLIKPALGRYEVAKLTAQTITAWHHKRANTAARLRTSEKAEKQNAKPLDTPEDRRKRQSTANRDLTVLKAALNHAYRQGRVASDDAWRKVKPFGKVERAKLRYLSDDEARRLVNAVSSDFRPIIQAALLTGARYQELAGLKVADVDLKAGTVWFMDTKAGRPRVSYLEGEGVSLFRAQTLGKAGDALIFPRPDGERWNDAQQARPLRQACEAAKIRPPASFHDLRRTYGARLALRGVPMAVIAEALGHADERITRRHYAHLSPSYVADTVRANVAGMGIFNDTDGENIAEFRQASA